MYLPDINFWLALNFSGHANHSSAKAWFDDLPNDSRCDFCRYTQMGFLRLSTNAKATPLQTRTMSQAWVLYASTLTDPRVGYAGEPAGLEIHWTQISQRNTFSHNVWNDAYLAAFALAGGYEVVTFDKGFVQYAGLSCTFLS